MVLEVIKLILFVVCMCNRNKLNNIIKDFWFIKKYILIFDSYTLFY